MGMINLNISDVLFSKVLQRILALLYGQPHRHFYTNEIIRLSNSGTGAVLRELNKLSAVGLVSVEIIGNQKHYQANQNALLFSELRNIVLKTFGLTDVLRHTLEPIAFVFGSIAKQTDTTNSDIDLMLISDNIGYAEVFTVFEEVQKELGRTINPTCYSSSEWARKRDKNNNFIIQIIEQPKLFLIGTENELREIK